MINTFDSVKKAATEKEEKKFNLYELDDDMTEMLKVAQNSKNALQEMNDAFTGMEDSDYTKHFDKNNRMCVRKVSAKRKNPPRGNSETSNRLKSAVPRTLAPIQEEPRDDS